MALPHSDSTLLTSKDTTAATRRSQVQKLKESTLRELAGSFDAFDGAICLYDENERKVLFNRTFKDLHSFENEADLIGMTMEECIRIQIRLGIYEVADEDVEAYVAERMYRFRNPTGPIEVEKPGGKWYRLSVLRLDHSDHTLLIMENISEVKQTQKALEKSEERFKEFAETAADLFWEIDESNRLSYLSDQFAKMVHGLNSLARFDIGVDLVHLFNDELNADACKQLHAALESESPFNDIVLQLRSRTRTNVEASKYLYLSFSGLPITDSSDRVIGYRGTARNITKETQLTSQLKHEASHDALTGLLSRREFNSQLEHIHRSAIANRSKATLGFIDIDEFKVVNDTVGHPTGDLMLKEIAAILRKQLGENAVIARLGGDEFAVILENTNTESAYPVVQGAIDAIRKHHFVWKQKNLSVTASVGLVEINAEVTNRDGLLHQVDVACFAAKRMGRNQLYVFDPEDPAIASQNSETVQAARIQEAIDRGSFTLLAQPIAHSGAHTSPAGHHEILIRMLDGDGQMVPPDAFIPVAERFRLMTEIDRWVVNETLSRISEANDRGVFAINLSGMSLCDSSFADEIRIALRTHGVNPEQIIFEVTETAAIGSVNRACEFMDVLSEIGCRFSIDDFGSGLSSFAYLKRFNASYLKIDGSLITEVATDETDRILVSGINQMAHALGMQTVAEFVENDDIIQVLRDEGIDFLQGYGIGRPIPLSEVLDTKTGTENQKTAEPSRDRALETA